MWLLSVAKLKTSIICCFLRLVLCTQSILLLCSCFCFGFCSLSSCDHERNDRKFSFNVELHTALIYQSINQTNEKCMRLGPLCSVLSINVTIQKMKTIQMCHVLANRWRDKRNKLKNDVRQIKRITWSGMKRKHAINWTKENSMEIITMSRCMK